MSDRITTDARLLPIVAIIVVAFGFLARGNTNLIQAATFAAIDAVAAIGLSVLLGNVAQISLGQAGFFAIGAYTLGYLGPPRSLCGLSSFSPRLRGPRSRARSASYSDSLH